MTFSLGAVLPFVSRAQEKPAQTPVWQVRGPQEDAESNEKILRTIDHDLAGLPPTLLAELKSRIDKFLQTPGPDRMMPNLDDIWNDSKEFQAAARSTHRLLPQFSVHLDRLAPCRGRGE